MSTLSDRELVLGVPRRLLPEGAGWRGVLHGELSPWLQVIEREGTYRPRGEVEADPSWKQAIPYLVLRDGERLFLMRRTRAGSDARLHERWTLGIGGHVNPGDGGLLGGLRREFGEELEADWQPHPRLVGLLNDDSDPVGAVHVGIVYEAETEGRAVAVRERHKLEGSFVAPADVLGMRDRLETWSSLLYDFMTGRTPGTRVSEGPRGRMG